MLQVKVVRPLYVEFLTSTFLRFIRTPCSVKSFLSMESVEI